VRYSDQAAGGYADPANLSPAYLPIQSIATSHAQNDSGLFELNFRDERYLPFEGAGAISRWKLELPGEFRQFDYDTISDIVLHMRYSARDGGEALKTLATAALRDRLNRITHGAGTAGLVQAFSLRYDFPTEWYQFLKTAGSSGDHIQAFPISRNRFPYMLRGRAITINQIDLLGAPKKTDDPVTLNGLGLRLLPGGNVLNPHPAPMLGMLAHAQITAVNAPFALDVTGAAWEFTVDVANTAAVLTPLEDLLILCSYSVS
jgi:hypothetical protein